MMLLIAGAAANDGVTRYFLGIPVAALLFTLCFSRRCLFVIKQLKLVSASVCILQL